MTTEKKQQIKNSLPTYVSLANLLLLVSLIVAVYARGQSEESTRKDVESNTRAILRIDNTIYEHKSSTFEHRTMDDLMIKFVPRQEITKQFDALMKSNDEIKVLIKEKHKQ